MKTSLTRRDLLAGTAAAGVAGMLQNDHAAAIPQNSKDSNNIYFGDFHNHSAVGYAKGSLARAFEIANNHLDFFAFTPHGWWHDIKHYEGGIEKKWLDGFEATQKAWPDVLAEAKKYDKPDVFVPMVGFEWHSTGFGDTHLIFPDLNGEYVRYDNLREFQRFAKSRNAILIPHHPGNLPGHRGANLKTLDLDVSPVIEIFSEWGNAEHDRGPFPYIRHSHGGRSTRNTWRRFLEEGYRLGVVASTDDHLGFPGAYREGLAAVIAPELTREAIFDALRNRRTYAVTGDRIELDFQLNDEMMGRELTYTRDRKLQVVVNGWDEVERVEVLKNNRVIKRDFPVDRESTATSWNKPVLVRIEYGWGPWASLGAARVCDWNLQIDVEGGRIENLQTGFQSGPYVEGKIDRVVEQTAQHVQVQSFTARKDNIDDLATKCVVLRIQGGPDTKLTVTQDSGESISRSRTLKELAVNNDIFFLGEYPSESVMIHRVVFEENYTSQMIVDDDGDGSRTDWYDVRAIQSNGQMAWSSPIWVEENK
jgi:hypothetical protein